MTEPGTVSRLRRLTTDELTSDEIAAIRAILEAAFGSEEDERFTEDDWQHALGGTHVVLDLDGKVVAHAAVVGRTLRVGARPLRTGYVEAVAVLPARQRRGYGSAVMRDVGAIVAAQFELGALGTGSHQFYERLGWRTWRGPSSVRMAGGETRPTPDEDGFILVLATSQTPWLDLEAPISCEWRPGDVW